jgi:pimeloyl-ACP methyl ester carboxylesterase
MSAEIVPFHIAVPDSELVDLKRRLAATRWPDAETVDDWSQGVPLAKLRALVDHWLNHYDWRRCEAALNSVGQYRTQIDGLKIHFTHVRSRHSHALPLILTHGWPGSILEFQKLIGPLTDPTAYGGREEDAFHVVIPSLPGFGFSDKPTSPDWGLPRVAQAWAVLMARLGYTHYVAQGGDWGAGVTSVLGLMRPEGLAGIHVNFPLVFPVARPEVGANPQEEAALAALAAYEAHESGYAKQQATRPQTIGYALNDSPVGQAAWIYEKFHNWTDSGGVPETVLSLDDMLDNITLYWLTGTAASAGRIYWHNAEAVAGGFAGPPLELPVGCSIFPHEIFRAPRSWADQTYRNIIYWNEPAHGGHFAAFEQPQIFVDELRACFSSLRQV